MSLQPLSADGQRLLEMLPAYYYPDGAPDPIIGQILEAQAGESGRARDRLAIMLATIIPSLATDQLGMLGRWEYALGLPVRPAGISESERRGIVVAVFRARRIASGRDWKAAMDAALGEGTWQHFEHTPNPNQLTIEVAYAGGSYRGGLVRAVATAITPANQEIIFSYGDGFIVGTSEVGDAI